MTRAVSELTGAELALWVARATGLVAEVRSYEMADGRHYYCNVRTLTRNYPFSPHEDWAQGGPIIVFHEIAVAPIQGRESAAQQWELRRWNARMMKGGRDGLGMEGATALVAAMRALVASVYGGTVPDEVAT